MLAALIVAMVRCGPATPSAIPPQPPPALETGSDEAAPLAEARPVALSLSPLAPGVWLHTSVRELAPYGRVVSHGLVLRGDDGAVLVDTAWGNEATARLLADVERELGQGVVAAVVTDFHADRAGGLETLERAGVAVHTSAGVWRRAGTAEPAEVLTSPNAALSLAGNALEVFAPGPGHSAENLVVWIPERRILFGGCLVRPFDSRGLGNVADADLLRWSTSVQAVLERYPLAEVVIPSHGDPGGLELLHHTRALTDGGWASQAVNQKVAGPPIRVAITVDDLPRHGPLAKGTTRTEIHRELLAAFETHGVAEAWGFVNGGRVESADDRAALQAWVDAGHPLGNHTWSHLDLRSTPLSDYLADIDRNEPLIAELTPPGVSWPKMFRYPFLQQGLDRESSDAIRKHLSDADYRIAEVSIDFWDWDYQRAYERCRSAGATKSVEALRRTYLQRAVATLRWHEDASVRAFGRPIAHVLLLHAGAMTADTAHALLSAYEDEGVQWITLAEALADPVYRDVPLPPKTRGDVIVEQAVVSLGAEHPPWPAHPGALLATMCESP